MWGLLRIVLLIANAGWLAVFSYLAATEKPSLEWWQALLFSLVFAVLGIAALISIAVEWLWP
jgi:hypothetical protein